MPSVEPQPATPAGIDTDRNQGDGTLVPAGPEEPDADRHAVSIAAVSEALIAAFHDPARWFSSSASATSAGSVAHNGTDRDAVGGRLFEQKRQIVQRARDRVDLHDRSAVRQVALEGAERGTELRGQRFHADAGRRRRVALRQERTIGGL